MQGYKRVTNGITYLVEKLGEILLTIRTDYREEIIRELNLHIKYKIIKAKLKRSITGIIQTEEGKKQ